MLVAGCVADASPASTAASAPVSAATPSPVFCPEARIRLPSGDAIDLSGDWIGVGERNALPRPALYEFRTFGGCLVWIGLSNEEGQEPGTLWSNVFMGSIGQDFTIKGDWSLVHVAAAFSNGAAPSDRGRGTLVVRIEPIQTDSGYKVRLVLIEATSAVTIGTGTGTFVTGIWVRPGDEALFDIPVE